MRTARVGHAPGPAAVRHARPHTTAGVPRFRRVHGRNPHAILDDEQLAEPQQQASQPSGDQQPAYSTDSKSGKSDTAALFASYAKYLPKGTRPEDVDWALLNPSLSTPNEPPPHAQPRLRERTDATASASTSGDPAFTAQLVQWYPGHIAKAERQLKEQLSKVDVVMEVLDARIPASTTHPQLQKWAANKPRVLVLNRTDMISARELQEWKDFFRQQVGREVFCTNGQQGKGIIPLKQRLLEVGELVNEKRSRRGLQPRAVRACVVGFPNIGKSALINRLLGRRVVDSAPLPGVTRALRWVRLGGEVDLLDAPGVIPASFNDQRAAQRLAMCNDIGQAAYEDTLIAAALVARMRQLPSCGRVALRFSQRYKIDPRQGGTGEEYVGALADRMFLGNRGRAGLRLLQDFRGGLLGSFALEAPADWQHREPSRGGNTGVLPPG